MSYSKEYGTVWRREKYHSDPEYKQKELLKNEEWRKKNQEKKTRGGRRRRSEKKQERINYLGGKCVGCGTTQDLQFDHIDRTLKEYAISSKPDYTLDKIKPELDKCRLLCKSCHIVKTRVNHDHEQILKGYELQSITREDNRITIVYEVH